MFLWIGWHRCVLTASKLLHLEAKVSLQLGEIELGLGIDMESYHWFFLGMMAAFTPGVFVLSILLARSMDQSETGRFPSFRRPGSLPCCL